MLSAKLQSSLAERDRAILSDIVRSGRKLHKLVESLLQYATIESAADKLEEFALNDVLEDVRANLADVIQNAGADVSWGRMPVIRAHRARIMRLLQNLTSNAIKYARPGVSPVVRISAVRESKGEWRIDVADNGAGIAPEYLEKVFAPLARLHGPEIAGAGLGLAICERVAESEGGRIWVDSVVGQGSTFHILLPGHTPIDFATSA